MTAKAEVYHAGLIHRLGIIEYVLHSVDDGGVVGVYQFVSVERHEHYVGIGSHTIHILIARIVGSCSYAQHVSSVCRAVGVVGSGKYFVGRGVFASVIESLGSIA